MRALLHLFAGLLLAGAMSSGAQAAPLPAPQGPVVLTVTGDIRHTNGDGVARFDRAMLEALPSRSIITDTPWHDAAGRFEGPLAEALLEAVGAQGDHVRVVALNGFEAEIPVSDFERYGVILAMTRNGEIMPIRRFGPLFVLYPFDAHPELLTEAIRFRSVWQVTRIQVH
ncbi:oxidoreductase [Halomonas beimenensis]|uniref:Oxidoreductase molybdopterin-binding domain-containing protein n=1 Tax=Halomonas beimenensis TaxID=475662 RepID=A0A291PAU1_9GAMM|nr:oxidoreductase [Halomonas beimenensis]ATJ83981.1 hypothetical protein BEI_2994 [Halomonas beimenensis]